MNRTKFRLMRVATVLAAITAIVVELGAPHKF
jgi:hypothetical protein